MFIFSMLSFVTDFLGIGQLSVDSNVYVAHVYVKYPGSVLYTAEAQSNIIPALFGFPCKHQFEQRKRSCFAPPRDGSVSPVTSVPTQT